MKKLMNLTALVAALTLSNPAQALFTGETQDLCGPGGNAANCTLMSWFSMPTLIVGADPKGLTTEEANDYIVSEALNYADGIEGEYLLLKATAKRAKISTDVLVARIIDQM